MRQRIDCAVMVLEAHRLWMPKVLQTAEPALSRIQLHPLEWEAGHDLEIEPASPVSLPIETIAQAAVGLRRYDIALLSVSMETLAWTRQALGAIPRGPFIPIIGVLKDMRSAAIQDLLELGMSDFVRLPVCPEELRARLLSTVTKVPRPGSLREPEPGYGQARWLTDSNPVLSQFPGNELPYQGPARKNNRDDRMGMSLREGQSKRLLSASVSPKRAKGWPLPAVAAEAEPMSLKAAKAAVVEQFERQYIADALAQNNGNIAMAARHVSKHRRAFWGLMRKYEIEATDFRNEDLDEREE